MGSLRRVAVAGSWDRFGLRQRPKHPRDNLLYFLINSRGWILVDLTAGLDCTNSDSELEPDCKDAVGFGFVWADCIALADDCTGTDLQTLEWPGEPVAVH
jgi:hypothetical protein